MKKTKENKPCKHGSWYCNALGFWHCIECDINAACFKCGNTVCRPHPIWLGSFICEDCVQDELSDPKHQITIWDVSDE